MCHQSTCSTMYRYLEYYSFVCVLSFCVPFHFRYNHHVFNILAPTDNVDTIRPTDVIYAYVTDVVLVFLCDVYNVL